MIGHWKRLSVLVVTSLALAVSTSAEPLKVIYSDWPGWTALQIGIEKGWFKKAGLDIEFVWTDYVAGLDAFAAGNADAYCVTNGDALVIGATASKPSVCILVQDYSNGNDMLIGSSKVKTVKDLKGKKVGLEVGFVSHLLLLTALKDNGMTEKDVTLVNVPTSECPNALATGGVDAVSCWQPASGQARKVVPDSNLLYSSAKAPGVIYDCVFVTAESHRKNRAEWVKFVDVWYDIVDFIKDEKNKDEVLKILSARVNLTPEEYEPLLKGTYFLSLKEALKVLEARDGLDSIWGSTKYVDKFNVTYEVYKKPEFNNRYLDTTITEEVAKKRGVKK